MATKQHTPEQDLRLDLLNTLLTTPHRQLAGIWPIHRDMVERDPRFYVQLAAWYSDHGDVRDHKEMFVVTLTLSDFPGHRDVGLALLRDLPPYEVVRVVDFIHGRKTTRKVRPQAAEGTKATAEAEAAVVTTMVEDFGLFRNPPRSLRTEVTRYLREREAAPEWFDSSVLVARKAMKRLYALLHISPGERAQKILFEEAPPTDSRVYALKVLSKAVTPEEQARAILENAIPYRVAASVVKEMAPPVLRALVEVMSPQELINNLGALQKRGAFAQAEIKALIDIKLEQARSGPRVSAFKTEEAMKAAKLSDDIQKKLEAVADTQIKAKGRITRPTALLIDKSSSMELAIELGKRIGAMLSAVCEADLFVYAFDTMAYPIERAGEDMASWEKALQGIKAGGATSCGVPLEVMIRKRQYAEQIVMISDQEENAAPHFVPTLQKYRTELKSDPNVYFVQTPRGGNHLEQQCHKAGLTCDAFRFTGDYYSLPNLVPMLSRPSKLDLLMEIIEYPLPVRKAG